MLFKNIKKLFYETIENENLKEQFEVETKNIGLERIKLTCFIGIFFYPIFGILDLFIYPEKYLSLWILRAIFVCLCIIIYLQHNAKIVKNNISNIGMVIMLFSGIIIASMCHLTGGPTSLYYAGINLTLLVLVLILLLDVRRVFMTCAIVYVYYMSPIFLSIVDVYNVSDIISNNFFLLTTMILCIIGTFFKNKSRLEQLRVRIELENSNKNLEKITNKLEASNKKLLELDQIKMRFFANVSHELRTPLTLIIGPLEQLLQGWNDMDPVPMLKAMEANAHRLLRQVNTILDFAKADVGMLNCHYKKGNLGEILSNLVQSSLPYAKQRNIELTVSGTHDIPDTAIDFEKVETIAVNLISNALKFTSDKGNVHICAGTDKEVIWFEVQDTGMGIPEEKIDNIFERFHQVDDQHSRKNEGTGLGLAMVRELTLLHGGKVSVRSKLGKGSVFRVELPMNPPPPESDRRKNLGRRKIDKVVEKRIEALMGMESLKPGRVDKKTLFADIGRGSGLGDSIAPKYKDSKKSAPPDAQKVLVVEDNPDLRAFIVSNLFETYVVEEAENGRKGLYMARRVNPDLIVSDVMMPEMDGYEMCREIRKDPFLFDVPVILVTAKTGISAIEEGLEIGANDYIPKPFEMRELKARIASQLKNRQLEKRIDERDTRLSAIGQMTSSIVHDLKNPLNTLTGFAQIARQDSEEIQEKNISRNLDLVMESCSRLNRMISEIMDFAKGYAPRLNMEGVLLVPFLETTLNVHKNRLKDLGISLVSRYTGCDTVYVSFDSEKMNRVIENLIMNSKEAFFNSTHDLPDKQIRVDTSCDKNRALICFSDNGPGIPEEIQTSIFDPFTTTGKKTGVGLGLSTVRNIVTAHSGTIDVKNDDDTGGAVFELIFPVVQS